MKKENMQDGQEQVLNQDMTNRKKKCGNGEVACPKGKKKKIDNFRKK